MKKSLGEFAKRLSSRKFIVAVIASVVAFGNFYFDWGIELDEVLTVLFPIISFIAAEGAKDIIVAGK